MAHEVVMNIGLWMATNMMKHEDHQTPSVTSICKYSQKSDCCSHREDYHISNHFHLYSCETPCCIIITSFIGNRLQSELYAAVRNYGESQRYDYIIPYIIHLHWCPVKHRIISLVKVTPLCPQSTAQYVSRLHGPAASVCLYTVEPIFMTTWEIGTTWELSTATPVPRPTQCTEMDLKNKTTSELRTAFHSPLGVPNSQVPLYVTFKHPCLSKDYFLRLRVLCLMCQIVKQSFKPLMDLVFQKSDFKNTSPKIVRIFQISQNSKRYSCSFHLVSAKSYGDIRIEAVTSLSNQPSFKNFTMEINGKILKCAIFWKHLIVERTKNRESQSSELQI